MSDRVLSNRGVGRLRLRAEQPEDSFVHAEHDGSTRNCPEKMRSHASIQAKHAFFFPHQLKALDKAGVFGPAISQRSLAESSPGNL